MPDTISVFFIFISAGIAGWEANKGNWGWVIFFSLLFFAQLKYFY